ncbi:hypothetical protein GCM10010156_49100 [Planobispora rosea]|uniref:Uncharacterized protein n=1 Tax=Planobispora rosea TaxID=35762 RepID=A0A8J3S5N8_PLARO|nr:hypothetical protein [Planobispora rosea]GGS84642.1 hypothetical protein GCM10010156_49100 [Planobispora rosea]GIH86421.1 hypothetical protein Pro02_48290 [Planobispora rosea]
MWRELSVEEHVTALGLARQLPGDIPGFVVATQLQTVQAWHHGEITLEELLARTGWDLTRYADDDLEGHRRKLVSFWGGRDYEGWVFVGRMKEFMRQHERERQVLQLLKEVALQHLKAQGITPPDDPPSSQPQ